jgi:hypothetical protein
MNRTFFVIMAGFALLACKPATISLSDGSCPTLRDGDFVEGVAKLTAYRGPAATRFDASLTRKMCPGEIGLMFSREEVWPEYRLLLRQLPSKHPTEAPDHDPDFVESDVLVSGRIVIDRTDDGLGPWLDVASIGPH